MKEPGHPQRSGRWAEAQGRRLSEEQAGTPEGEIWAERTHAGSQAWDDKLEPRQVPRDGRRPVPISEASPEMWDQNLNRQEGWDLASEGWVGHVQTPELHKDRI